ncbi:mechanosensitive ion channel family protein [Hyphomonas johnsonii]|uniref:Mechanosensitive ion channel MscS n=1 Tax=Hyphomonas johnsonii MHS-2 TaxID=1280950 RepID=A0A059FQ75_9PROT|nr:mechanosensitive ion channel domain-containing protein [Hyphomonas johnsonii]KCZ92666.1 mechanosensitive ion channel MscS [Hyphomonas johnsonii MHS-2]
MEEGEVTFQKCITGSDGFAYCRPVEAGAVPPGTAPAPAALDTLPHNPFEAQIQQAQPFLSDPGGWIHDQIVQPDFLISIGLQLGAILLALLIGLTFSVPLKRLVTVSLRRFFEPPRGEALTILRKGVRPALWALLLFGALSLLSGLDQPTILVRIALSLAVAWTAIRVATGFLPSELRRPIASLTWIFAILFVFGVLPEVIDWLSAIGPKFGVGDSAKRISPIFVIQAVITAALFMYAASWLAAKMKRRVNTLPKVEPSIRILIGSTIQIALFVAAALLTLAGLGIPVEGLAVLGGAIGLGLGFGMQKVVSNFVSGIILLSERSIKPNDVIEVGTTFGVVESLGLRYTSVTTQEGKEFLIPNEQLVTDKVVNWSFSNRRVRISKELRIDYISDLEEAIAIVIEAAKATPRVIKWPEPVCLVKDFTDEGIQLEMRFWIVDPEHGTANVASNILREVWKRFTENGMSTPLRRKEIVIEPDSTLNVNLTRAPRTPKPGT